VFYRRRGDKLLIPIILLVVFIASSYRAKYHLRNEMPGAFFQEDRKSKTPSLDEKIAGAYWERALMEVQWKYGYSHSLPPDPPAEFQIDAAGLGPGGADPAARMLYWHRLQQIWYSPETWKKEYGWDLTWLGDPLTSAAEWIKVETSRLFSVR
jgi:hypothetical protein